MYYKKYALYTGALLLSNVSILPSYAADAITQAYSEGKAYIDINTRYEYVNENNSKQNADGLNMRARVGYDTGTLSGFSGKIEFSHNTDLGIDNFNSKQNGQTQYSVIADPGLTEVNQAFIDFKGLENTRLRYGRQRIKLDQDRFIGNVGWRLNEQTYDGFTATNESLPDTKITYGYIDKVQTFLGTRINHNTNILNAKYKGIKAASLTGYYYGLENKDNQLQSSNTYGFQVMGKMPINKSLKINYLGEYASQSDAKANSHNFTLDYYHLKGGIGYSAFNVNLGYEVLGGNGTDAFQTPLATKHAWNGWADKFLTTPADGLEDGYITVGGKVWGVKAKAVYHDYNSNNSSIDYGNELDLVLVKAINKNYKVLVKYADYNANSYSVDTQKFWLGFNAKFSQ